MSYCLQKFTGRPEPNAQVKSSGTVTFALPGGQIRSEVDVEQNFGSDGKRARQKLTGTVTEGTGTYEGVKGNHLRQWTERGVPTWHDCRLEPSRSARFQVSLHGSLPRPA